MKFAKYFYSRSPILDIAISGLAFIVAGFSLRLNPIIAGILFVLALLEDIRVFYKFNIEMERRTKEIGDIYKKAFDFISDTDVESLEEKIKRLEEEIKGYNGLSSRVKEIESFIEKLERVRRGY